MPKIQLKPNVSIEDHSIGIHQKVFIIAEIGVNHNGDFELAKQHIDAAKQCEVDCVKFQTFRAEEFMADKNLEYEYDSGGKKVKENMFDMFKRLELPRDWHLKLFDYARQKGLLPLTSVADPESTNLALEVGMNAFKLSSEDLINLPLIEHVIQKRKPILFSTGMSDQEEVQDVLDLLAKHEHNEAVFLHCVSLYPTPDNETNLKRMLALAALTQGPVGYSDHTIGIEASLAAVSMGACVIEKHFTLDKNLPGPDHALSSDPQEMQALVQGIRRIENMMGEALIEPSFSERQVRKEYRRSLVAKNSFPKGHKLSREDLVLKRPGKGLRHRDAHLIVGKVLTRDIQTDEMILPEDTE